MPFDAKTLAQLVAGQIILPGDAEYGAARTGFYGGFDKRPAAIVRVRDAADVAAVVNFARETGTELAVRSGGHSLAGHSVSDGGIVLDLKAMQKLEFDLAAESVWAETGLTAGAVTAAADQHDRVVPFGDTGSVGIGGITVCGGVGYLVRKHGLTIDNLLAAELVTADGQVRQVDATSEPDLFWALRGGGGNFGVATRFQYRLQPSVQAYGGMLLLPATAEVIAGAIALADQAPAELSGIFNIMPAPPMPFLPAEHHGTLSVMALLMHVGEPAAGEAAVAGFRGLATPLADMLKPIRYKEIFFPEDPSFHPTVVGQNLFIDQFNAASAEAVMEGLNSLNAPMRVVQLRVLGGAAGRVPVDATAFAHRERKIMANVAAFYQTETEKAERQAWVDALAARLRGTTPGAYVGFLGAEGPDRLHAAYPDTHWKRLAAIKQQVDPTNLFRLNHNIPPAA